MTDGVIISVNGKTFTLPDALRPDFPLLAISMLDRELEDEVDGDRMDFVRVDDAPALSQLEKLLEIDVVLGGPDLALVFVRPILSLPIWPWCNSKS